MTWGKDEIAAVRAEVGRMTAAPAFVNAGRMGALLSYLVEAELEGASDKLNQSRIAIDVFGRDAKFDPSTDSIVRVEMGRLRTKLTEFYATDGKDDAVVIGLPKGRYRVSIEQRPKAVNGAKATNFKQDIRFCNAKDGVKIAYAISGSGTTLVKTPNWLSHLEYDSQSPVWRHWWRDLSERFQLVRSDPRGCGLSDWSVGEFSFEDWISDLERVVDEAAPGKFALLGTSMGASIAITYAVRHPDRVSHLILYGGFAQGTLTYNETEREESFQLIQDIVRVGWGKPHGAFRQVIGSMFMPEGTAEQFRWFDELSRVSMTSENALRAREVTARMDVSALLPQLSVPTLVLHARDEILVPFSDARWMAARIPGARLVALDSKNHLILEHELAWARFLEEVATFVAGTR